MTGEERRRRIVSVRDVEHAAKNGRSIVVPPGVVVTPAARERAAELNVVIRVQRERVPPLALTLPPASPAHDLAEPLAAFILAAAAQPLPEEVLDHAKLLLIDSLAAGYAGLRCEAVRALVDALAARRAAERGHLIGLRYKLAPAEAALVNAALIHAFAFDPWFAPGAVAPLPGPVAAALAVSDELRLRDPKLLLPAIAIGVEVACRIAAAATSTPLLSRTAAVAALGGVATGAVLFALDFDAILSAFGLALSQALLPPDEGGDMGPLVPGLGAQAAVQAARLAAGGVRGPRRSIEGPGGYAHLVEGGHFDREAVLEGLGASWRLEQVAIRPYPVDPAAAAAIEAAVRLVARRIPAERIAQVVLEGSARVVRQSDPALRPALTGREPPRRLPYLLARTLRDGWIGLAALEMTAPVEPEVWDLMERIELAVAPDVPPEAITPLRLLALTTDGVLLEAVVEEPPGALTAEITRERVLAKLADCFRWSGQPRYRRPLRLADAVDALDRAQSLQSFWSAVSPQAAL
ncbi:MAG: MmgE/PrpD family protein [Chloroflexota bacterium]|nr:MmgE/PrpD family protein [Dehalococcoidia bacterium]MDW8253223.1 MmgE/PrpD family protein [Chloroflexota bacterium]